MIKLFKFLNKHLYNYFKIRFTNKNYFKKIEK